MSHINNQNILIFPKIKKPEKQIDLEKIKEITEDEYEEIANHYVTELSKHLVNHGFEIDDFLFRDLFLTFESIKSAMMRANNKYYYIQEYSDIIYQESTNDESEQIEKTDDSD